MAFELRLTRLALEDIDQAFNYYALEGSLAVATKWLTGIEAAIASLRDMPTTHGFAPENDDLEFDVRQIHFKSHRILFMVTEPNTVDILRIYHGARKPVTAEDFKA